MKKFLTGIILFVLAALLCFSAACDDVNWHESDVTLKNWGAILENDGFIAKTENYVYYINGYQTNTANNEFAMPIKGSLVAAKISDIVAGNPVEKCIVVPKLFVAQDYNMGVFIYGNYVYYMTPTTDKDSSGSVAYNEMEFTRTRLDGTNTQTLIKIGKPTDQYRILEKDGTVYLVLNETKNSRIVCYNVSTGSLKEIAKINEKSNVKTSAEGEADEYESLNSFTFVDRNYLDKGVVVFTTNVYLNKYDSAAAERTPSQYSRKSADYNKLYVYNVGENSAKLVLSGKEAQTRMFSISLIKDGYVYYTSTDSSTLTPAAQTYRVSLEALAANTGDDIYNLIGTQVINTAYVNGDSVIVDADEVYTNASGIVKKVSLTDKNAQQQVANITSSATLLNVAQVGNDKYLYYVNESNEYCRIKLDDESKYERISDGGILADWYKPCVLTLDGQNYAFYSDNTDVGKTYVKVVSIKDGTNLVALDEDGKVVDPTDPDANEIDHYYFDNSVMLGIMTNTDKANVVKSKIQEITDSLSSGKLVFDTDDDGNIVYGEDGLPLIAKIDEAAKLYSALNSGAKDKVGDSYTLFKKYKEAYEVSRLFYKLNDFDLKTKEQKDALKDAYKECAARHSKITEKGFNRNQITDLCVEKMVWYYQQATEYFK